MFNNNIYFLFFFKEDLMQQVAAFIDNVCQYIQAPLAVSVVNQLLSGLKCLIQFQSVDILSKEYI